MNSSYHCLECGHGISQGIFDFSTEVFGYALCLKHQALLNECGLPPEAVTLYLELKTQKVDVELEYWDGTKTVDIAIPGKLNITVNSNDHDEPEEAFTELLRTIDSWKDNVPSLHVSCAEITNTYQLEMIVDRITGMYSSIQKTA